MTGISQEPRLGGADPGVVSSPPGRWPARRVWSGVGLLAALVLLVAAGPGWAFTTQPLWSVLTLGALAAASVALATFVPLPGEGLHVHLGCGPCAAVGGLAAVGSAWLALTSALDAGTASLALALAGFGLARRVTEPQTCARPF
ncbi:hypothetical protein [Humibacillus xanthopallidus]|uniref:Uncharacterized protein n=1 Tax=Humibacillus xanthopallidus TaxID=412689 RepID=A0A543HUV1_9MICO|nr:hypothetical protein [Humibacillus xanthopallidus]TQM62123.1 hypothetical protein FBY41_2151 [Humibacillus xanthopallidus]